MLPAPHLFLPPYHGLSYEDLPPIFLLRLATAYAEHAAERSGAAMVPPPLASGQRATDGRLAVGYLSTDFGAHPTSHLMRSFWALQQAHGRVRATCFPRSNDGSEQRAHLMSTCEEWVDLTGLSWAEVRRSDATRSNPIEPDRTRPDRSRSAR